jgi:hypothetical protein
MVKKQTTKRNKNDPETASGISARLSANERMAINIAITPAAMPIK